jgi:uroporphyrinogen-III synthase
MTHPLTGKRIVITRAETQADGFADALRAVGAVPLLFPTIALTPTTDSAALDAALSALPQFDWLIFTSVNGVRFAMDRLAALGLTTAIFSRVRVAVIGPATAQALAQHNIHVDLQPGEFVAEALLAALANDQPLTGRRFLLLRAEAARPLLRDELQALGGQVTEIPVYQTQVGAPSADAYAQLRAGFDCVTFTSPLTARYFCALLGEDAAILTRDALIACIGPITDKAVVELGLPYRDKQVAESYTVPGLLALLTDYYEPDTRYLSRSAITLT